MLRNLLPLSDAADHIADADLLLWRVHGWWPLSATLTAIAGRGQWYHAAMAAWWEQELMCLEARMAGIRAVTLRSQVEQYPGAIDVFAADPRTRFREFRPDKAVSAMRAKTGRHYGFWNLVRTAATHAFLARLFVRADTNDNEQDRDDRRAEFCSQAVSSATRLGGGVDPVPQLRDRFTEPDDLAESAFYEYQFTLVP